MTTTANLIDKLKAELLKQRPLWSDILLCQRQGLSTAAVARVCGCKVSTLKRQLREMEEAGLFEEVRPC